MSEFTGTIIQNGCCYTATKIIRNGAEVELGGGGDKGKYVDLLLIGGGGGGGFGGTGGGGGGGAGGVICRNMAVLDQDTYSIVIGAGGLGCDCCQCPGGNGGNSCFGNMVAYGGGGGGVECYLCGRGQDGGSGGGAAPSVYCYGIGGCPTIFQGNAGGGGGGCCCSQCMAGGGGGGAGGGGGDIGNGRNISGPGEGGIGLLTDFDGTSKCYAGGGGGAGGYACACGKYGGGDGKCYSLYCAGGNATTYGSGGGGSGYYKGGCGCQGIAIVRYPTDGSYGINCACGGTVTTCTINGVEYKIHTFTTNGTFCIVS